MANLPTAVLGRTGLEVTRLGYGAMELRSDEGDRAVSEEHSTKVLNAVLDAGINFIDTAVCYGLSEERIGKAICTPARRVLSSPPSADARRRPPRSRRVGTTMAARTWRPELTRASDA